MERGIAELMFKANGDIRKICDQKLHQLYGKIVPDEILERLNAELTGIIDNGYESYYFIAQNIARISLGKGYMTGTRGTLAGSFVAYLMGITDINPLTEKYGGYNIPPEVHYGIDYSKKPEIVFNGYRSSDPERRILNTEKIRTRTDWTPIITLDKGLDMCVASIEK
jgi:DNA polymerase III alpha subunit (gram-positive type)